MLLTNRTVAVRLSIALLAALLVATPLLANDCPILGTAETKFISEEAVYGVNVGIDRNENGYWERWQSADVGTYRIKIQNPTGLATQLPGPYLYGICIEPDEPARTYYHDYDLVALECTPQGTDWLSGTMGPARANLLRELWGRFFDDSWTDGSYSYDERKWAAAFWLAAIEIIYEDPSNSFDIRDGQLWTYYTSDTVENRADWMLGQLDGDSSQFAPLVVLRNEYKQDYVVELPEPGTAVLLGVAGLLTLRRRLG